MSAVQKAKNRIELIFRYLIIKHRFEGFQPLRGFSTTRRVFQPLEGFFNHSKGFSTARRGFQPLEGFLG